MRVYNDLGKAIVGCWEQVINTGHTVDQDNWQGVKAPRSMFEATDVGFRAPMPEAKMTAQTLVKPNLPWADMHFEERVSGIPHNPPPSHEHWPFKQEGNKEFIKNEKFDHTYPERFWPKYAETISDFKDPRTGIRFEYGDLNDVIQKLIDDPLTRQAWLPIWFPEDTGKLNHVRVPCSLGYHFMLRSNRLDIKYIMRSTDMLRHFQDDIYMCYRLAYHVLSELAKEGIFGEAHKLGYMTFLTFSGHIFSGEEQLLDKKIKQWKG